ncbi:MULTISPECIES: cation:proton antiporter regulatory subunit [Bacillus]|uniref:Cation:proton antiporter regulatory subunit n=3 Tax=Bacillus amyloliquefaciens group TaxID=1938374 RepID=A7Z2Z8_BACVZ|nr:MULTISPECIES: cation:proton antiporter regulatory subunit [Bacillus]APH34972.1 potassium:proton antiporter [Bacillus subtilis]MBL3615286.1 cation:proton antiporter regulatory subunit [Bacillus sp. RHFS18]SLB87029.1 putative regulatory ligand binding protein, C-terminal domain of K+ channels like protein [Mycobacteroides abscessus subsp. massiliense]ABS73374.1 cation:proton antiporter regulatory subunit [Bacillus velezensis FZB42]AFJ61063.1 TrkA domain protein [Bacillus velezensis YAU B9601-
MNIKENDLPGIGKKFEIETRNHEKMTIIIHDDGRREIYRFDDRDPDELLASISLDDAEARQIAAIIGGMVYKPQALESIEMAFNDLIIEWFKVEKGAKAAGRTLGELDVRQNYDVTVIAIIKHNQKKLLNPGADSLLEANDTLVLSGERKHLKKLIQDFLSRDGV